LVNAILLAMTASTAPIDSLTLARPDDWHLHIRDGAAMAAVVPYTARQFGRAIIMPNLRPPITTTAQAVAYRERILAALPEGSTFEPLMTLYLTDNLPADEIRAREGRRHRRREAVPGGRDDQLRRRRHRPAQDLPKTLEAMQREGIKLLVHGEVTSPDIDLFDREAVFIDQTCSSRCGATCPS
jgi:dihydroorotase